MNIGVFFEATAEEAKIGIPNQTTILDMYYSLGNQTAYLLAMLGFQ
jgi:hypothetical protein